MTTPSSLKRLSVLIAINFVDMIGFAIVLPLLPFYALKLHASDFGVGMILACYSVAQILSAPLWGRVSDLYGRRPALLIGLLASAAAYVVFGLADTLWLYFAMRLIQGAGGGTTGVAQAYVADTIEPHERAKALGWLSAATSAGVMLGPSIGSFAYAKFGHAAPGFVAAALCLINAGFAWKWLPESHARPGADAPPQARRPVWHAAWQVVRSPGQLSSRLIWIYGVGMLAFTSITAVLALYLKAEFQANETNIGYFYTFTGALSLVMRSLLLGPIVERLGEPRTVRLGTLVLILGLVLYPQPHTILLFVAVMPFVPIGTALLFPSTTALLSHASSRAEYGTMMGVAQTFGGLARVAAPLIATFVFQHVGHAWPFYVAAAFVAVAALMAMQIPVTVPARQPQTSA
ncbi:MAG TPA: MFS transporter [Gemmatimonadales bacterium]|nr:MFS transporter [Gemmatimonadales bacterium]